MYAPLKMVDYFRYDGDLMGSDGKYYVPDWAVKMFEEGTLFYAETADSPSELFIKRGSGAVHVPVWNVIALCDVEEDCICKE